MRFICCFVLWLLTYGAATSQNYTKEIRMPWVNATEDDAYLCYAEPSGENQTYITSFVPIHNEEVTHHMILFACDRPTHLGKSWKCGDHRDAEPVCQGDFKIIFSWAMNAPNFELPPNTSFPIGGSGMAYLVLQVHYKDAKSFKKLPYGTDDSGWKLSIQTEPTPQLAGIYLFVTDGIIKPKGSTVVQTACLYTGTAVLHPIAFRVHAHSHGVMNVAYVYHNGKRYLIGAKSPQEKQTFYPVQNDSLVIEPADILSASCKMVNKENRKIKIGNTRNDEMCNFYMMYTVNSEDADQLIDQENQQCYSNGSIPKADWLDAKTARLIESLLDYTKPKSRARHGNRLEDDEDMDEFEEAEEEDEVSPGMERVWVDLDELY